MTPQLGVGTIVLLAELSHRAVHGGRDVVWTGFPPAPTDLGDVHHALAESGLVDRVTLSMADASAPAGEQLDAFDRGIRCAAGDALLVVFAETGRVHAVEERLPVLARRAGVTVVVAPLDGSATAPLPGGSPYLASVEFDVERARRRQWPAISPASWSKVAHPEIAPLAERARATTSDALEQYLAQRFLTTEPITCPPGESVALEDLRRDVARLLGDG